MPRAPWYTADRPGRNPWMASAGISCTRHFNSFLLSSVLPHPRIDAKNIREAAEGSLRRLGLDCIDLLQLHWPDRRAGQLLPLRFARQHCAKDGLELLRRSHERGACRAPPAAGTYRCSGTSLSMPRWTLRTSSPQEASLKSWEGSSAKGRRDIAHALYLASGLSGGIEQTLMLILLLERNVIQR